MRRATNAPDQGCAAYDGLLDFVLQRMRVATEASDGGLVLSWGAWCSFDRYKINFSGVLETAVQAMVFQSKFRRIA